jgi:hypothetical protein
VQGVIEVGDGARFRGKPGAAMDRWWVAIKEGRVVWPPVGARGVGVVEKNGGRRMSVYKRKKRTEMWVATHNGIPACVNRFMDAWRVN